ncbi:hypothetical protein BABINDRAFT_163529 [Babjeviella inositovora NRRL Y-12698]|uniref:Gti1/Pac2 family protein n=1 Tax=Babjeviella inositovora NRRL Y-12698 TaxID=984486 RepID=A0A1E3QIK9_9ASCO|nr:uncharacterized protein BABINDRAFT_163529 [Babjeviella inositovora NRRL Y-12698]ODQ77529.1 hypothetical protein BABINDRAFT_163529 [Babjeviella inositovora NRRL Y-12698]
MSTPLNPTYFGYIGSTKDALLVIQATLNQQLHAVPRRPHDRERNALIQSGNCFVFSEEKSGIKRWTDGIAWSPSRILGRFLVYRELDRSALSESDDRKNKRKKLTSSASGQQLAAPLAYDSHISPHAQSASMNTETGRQLVGSLVASYAFKEQGLIKKTLSLTVAHRSRGASAAPEVLHLISYYNADDVISGKLVRPQDSTLSTSIAISDDLWLAVKESSLGGKIPIEDEAHYFIDGKFLQATAPVRKKSSPPPQPLLYYGNSYQPPQTQTFGHFDEYPAQTQQYYGNQPDAYSIGTKRKSVYSPTSKPKSPELVSSSFPPVATANQPSWYTYGSQAQSQPQPLGFPPLAGTQYFLQGVASPTLPLLSQHAESYPSAPPSQQLLPHLFHSLSVSSGAELYGYPQNNFYPGTRSSFGYSGAQQPPQQYNNSGNNRWYNDSALGQSANSTSGAGSLLEAKEPAGPSGSTLATAPAPAPLAAGYYNH